jgi:hypothetical protein
MSERTVLVLGAGASASEAVHFRPSRTRDHPPLDATFFRRAARHAQQNLLDRVTAQGALLGQPDLFRDDPPVSLEEHLGRLYFEMQNSGSDSSRRAYFNLVQLYQSELLKTTNWMIGRSGCLKKLLGEELRNGRTVSIVTFKHDLLAENALALLAPHRHPGSWCIQHAYGIGELAVITSTGNQFETQCPGRMDTHVKVLKLHGSVNWVFRTRDPYPPKNFGQGSRRKLFLWTNTTLPDRVGVKLHTPGHGRDWYLWPFIVPPIYEKHGLIRGELEQVWRSARQEVARAERVIFWGYSFPRADLHARYFFESAANSNDALRRPVLINPDPAAEGELWKVLRPRSVRHYRHIGEYLDLENR